MAETKNKTRLDQIALDIEFLLISVIQGVALAALAAAAVGPFGDLRFEYWLYIISAFLLILNFWSQAIIHAISFIDWPLDLPHSFLYFLASLIEVMIFSHLTDPLRWFAFSFVFFIVAAVLYFYDLRLIKEHEKIVKDPIKKRFFAHIIKRQMFEYKVLLPSALIFNGCAFLLVLFLPSVFLDQQFHIALGAGQAFFALVVLIDATRNFKTRSRLIEEIQ